MHAVTAGILYFGLVYAAGFVLGPLRELAVVPLTGRPVAVLVEAPLMIAAMWLSARFVVGRLAIPARTASRTVVGLVGFALLMAAEAALSMVLRGWPLGQWVGHFTTGEGMISLALFLLFAAMPMLAWNTGTTPESS
jgi:hypothetical protein